MNPELQRNLQLDATPRKLAFSGAVLAGVFAGVWLLDRGRHASAVTLAGGAVFAAAALGWAPRAARRSVTGEVAAGSWDFQRLTAMTPAAMTWGKLAGATARPWALGAGGLLLAWLQLASTAGAGRATAWLVVALALAVGLQASGLATGLIDVRRARASGRPPSRRAPALVLIALGLLGAVALFALRAWIGGALARLGLVPGAAPPAPVVWFGQGYRPAGFAAATLIALAAWAVVWAWRLMRLELLHQNAPVFWVAFLACAGLYAFGFAPRGEVQPPLAARLSAAAAAWAVLAYLAAFAGPADRVRARQFAGAVRRREPARALVRLPLTVAPAALAVLAGLLVAALRARGGEGAAALAVLAALGFFGRDLGVIAWRRFAGRGAGGDGAVLLTLLTPYALLGPLGWTLARGRGTALFWPSPDHPRLTLCAALAEALLAWGLAALAVARPAPPPRPPRAPRITPPPPPTSVPPAGTAPPTGPAQPPPAGGRTRRVWR